MTPAPELSENHPAGKALVSRAPPLTLPVKVPSGGGSHGALWPLSARPWNLSQGVVELSLRIEDLGLSVCSAHNNIYCQKTVLEPR